MRLRIFISLLVFLSLLQAVGFAFISARPAAPPDEVLGVMVEAFPLFQEQALVSPQTYGFSTAADVENATVEEGYPVYRIIDEQLQSNPNNLYDVERYAQEWQFVVYSDYRPRTFIQIAFDEQVGKYVYQAAGGNPAPLENGLAVMRRYAGEQAVNVHLVKHLNQTLLAFEWNEAPYTIPLDENVSPRENPLDYEQTIRYLKSLTIPAVSETNAFATGGKVIIWLVVVLFIMLVFLRIMNSKLRKTREEAEQAERSRIERMKERLRKLRGG
jgi:hypothetical protein